MLTNALEADANAQVQTISFRSSTKAFLVKSGTGWLLLGVTVATFGMAAVVTVPLIALKYLLNVTSRFELQGDRLHMRTGILIRAEEEIELFRVKDIKASFSLIQQMFDNGNLEIISSDATGFGNGRRKSFVINNVIGVRAIREELRHRVDVARKRLGVREYDLS
jgi:uncharacterized membrane protein YdbT with pleckstrin-like domain